MLEGKSVYLIVNSTETHTERRTPRATKAIQADVEIVGQPFSQADRKFLTVQKVLEGSSFL